jgi:hypothetical protein
MPANIRWRSSRLPGRLTEEAVGAALAAKRDGDASACRRRPGSTRRSVRDSSLLGGGDIRTPGHRSIPRLASGVFPMDRPPSGANASARFGERATMTRSLLCSGHMRMIAFGICAAASSAASAQDPPPGSAGPPPPAAQEENSGQDPTRPLTPGRPQAQISGQDRRFGEPDPHPARGQAFQTGRLEAYDPARPSAGARQFVYAGQSVRGL